MAFLVFLPLLPELLRAAANGFWTAVTEVVAVVVVAEDLAMILANNDPVFVGNDDDIMLISSSKNQDDDLTILRYVCVWEERNRVNLDLDLLGLVLALPLW